MNEARTFECLKYIGGYQPGDHRSITIFRHRATKSWGFVDRGFPIQCRQWGYSTKRAALVAAGRYLGPNWDLLHKPRKDRP